MRRQLIIEPVCPTAPSTARRQRGEHPMERFPVAQSCELVQVCSQRIAQWCRVEVIDGFVAIHSAYSLTIDLVLRLGECTNFLFCACSSKLCILRHARGYSLKIWPLSARDRNHAQAQLAINTWGWCTVLKAPMGRMQWTSHFLERHDAGYSNPLH
jgi:hypothetical protein